MAVFPPVTSVTVRPPFFAARRYEIFPVLFRFLPYSGQEWDETFPPKPRLASPWRGTPKSTSPLDENLPALFPESNPSNCVLADGGGDHGFLGVPSFGPAS
jgi:hypothetical protein